MKIKKAKLRSMASPRKSSLSTLDSVRIAVGQVTASESGAVKVRVTRDKDGALILRVDERPTDRLGKATKVGKLSAEKVVGDRSGGLKDAESVETTLAIRRNFQENVDRNKDLYARMKLAVAG